MICFLVVLQGQRATGENFRYIDRMRNKKLILFLLQICPQFDGKLFPASDINLKYGRIFSFLPLKIPETNDTENQDYSVPGLFFKILCTIRYYPGYSRETST
jgi:hypothetical protein